jgi:predicted SnoaL-like aldol condensation-catalyzing enzyme
MAKASKVLIVDDDPELRDGLTEQLSLHEFEAVMVLLRFDRIEKFIDSAHYAQHASKIGDGIARLRDRIASVAKDGGQLNITSLRYVGDGNFVLVQSEGDLPSGPLRCTICFGSRTER